MFFHIYYKIEYYRLKVESLFECVYVLFYFFYIGNFDNRNYINPFATNNHKINNKYLIHISQLIIKSFFFSLFKLSKIHFASKANIS